MNAIRTNILRAVLLTPIFLAGPTLAADDLTGCTGKNCLARPHDINLPGGVTFGSGATAILNILTMVATVLSLIFIIVAGIRYATSGGNAQQITGAKNTITYAIIGLIIAILARSIIGFIIGNSPQ